MIISRRCMTLSIVFLIMVYKSVEGTMGGCPWSSAPPQLHRHPQPLAPSASRVPCSVSVRKVKHDGWKGQQSSLSLTYPDSLSQLRGGQRTGRHSLETTLDTTVATFVSILNTVGRTLLPPLVGCVRTVIAFYRTLPMDALIAQAGLVYCFAGGYYPTLFAALQAAQHCGWPTMIRALGDLTDEATKALEATTKPSERYKATAREIFTEKTEIVLKTIDPVKINQAAGALYTTWMGVSSVLQREFARTITLSMTMAGYLERVAQFVFQPPLYMCISENYHQWVPVIIGWGCKAAAMNVAWRIQRVLTATTCAFTGGVMFSRAAMRMLSKSGIRLFGLVTEDHDKSPIDEMLGFVVGGAGLYTQLVSGFDFQVPFPISLVTWPFAWAEKWIQWQITKDPTELS